MIDDDWWWHDFLLTPTICTVNIFMRVTAVPLISYNIYCEQTYEGNCCSPHLVQYILWTEIWGQLLQFSSSPTICTVNRLMRVTAVPLLSYNVHSEQIYEGNCTRSLSTTGTVNKLMKVMKVIFISCQTFFIQTDKADCSYHNLCNSRFNLTDTNTDA